jgi:hypothetical protein
MSSAYCGTRAGICLNRRSIVHSWRVPASRICVKIGMPQLACRTCVRDRSAHAVTAAGRHLVYHNILTPAPSQWMPASPAMYDNDHSSAVISRQNLMPERWQMNMLFKMLSDRRITGLQRDMVCPRLCTRSTCKCAALEAQLGGRCEDVDLGFFYILAGASSHSLTMHCSPLPCL